MAEIASAFVTLIPSFKGGGAKIASQLGGPVDAAGKSSGKRFGNAMSTGMGGIGAKLFAPIAAAAATVGVASFFKDAVSGASDLNETATKVVAIFGKGSEAVNKFADQGAKALGQTKQQVLDASATFGTFGKAAGLSGGSLAKFSTGFAGLSTDLASFSNTSPEQAVEAIGAALRGEAEPIRQYGVLLDDATLRTEALKLGLIKTTKQALTPQQKVLAAQAAIYKQTSDAQGDFARTSGGLANQQRILKAQFTDMKTTLGAALLPVVVKAVTALNSLFDQFKAGTGPLGAIKTALAPVVAGIKVFFEALGGGDVTVFGTFGKIGEVAYGIRDAFAAAFPVVKQFARDGLTALSGAGASIMSALGPVLKQLPGLFAQLLPVLTTVGATILSVFKNAFTQIGPLIASVANIVIGLFKLIAPAVQALIPVIGGFAVSLQGLASTLISAFTVIWPPIQRLIAGIITQLVPGLQQMFAVISTQVVPALQSFATAIAPIIAWLVDKLAPIVVTVFGVVVKVITAAFKIIAGIFKLGTALIHGDWSGAWKALKQISAAAIGAIWAVIKGAFKIIVSLFKLNMSISKKIWGAAWNAIKALAAAAWNGIVALVKAGMGKLKSAVSTGISAVVTFFKSVGSKITGALGDLGGLLKSAGSDIVQGLLDGITGAWHWVTDKISSLVAAIPEPIRKLLHINSPSKLMAEIGKQIPAGLIEGITSQSRKVDDTMRKLVDPDKLKLRTSTVALPGAAGSGAVGGGVAGGVTINGNIQGYTAKEVAYEIEQKRRQLETLAFAGRR